MHKFVFSNFSFIIKTLGEKAVAGLKNYEIKVTNIGHFFSYCKFVTYAGIYYFLSRKNITDVQVVRRRQTIYPR